MIKNIVLTAEQRADSPIDYEDLNTDVIVQFDNGDNYIATFYSLKRLKNMLETGTQGSDCISGPYYKVLDMVLVEDFKSGNLLSVIECMIAEGDFQLAFRKI